jgi:hypothetical protein
MTLVFFDTNILGITQYKLEQGIFFLIEFFVLWSTILCKKMGKVCSKITIVEV